VPNLIVFCGNIILEQTGKILNIKKEEYMKELTNKDQITLLKIKSLLNDLLYVIKEEDKKVINELHLLCRKYCSFGEQHEES